MADEIDTGAVRAYEKSLLAEICAALEQKGKPNFKRGSESSDFGVVQGALRGAYNVLGRLMQSPCLESYMLLKLERTGDRIFEIRDKLVRAVEVDEIAFKEAARTQKTSRNVGGVIRTLRGYITVWYKDEEAEF